MRIRVFLCVFFSAGMLAACATNKPSGGSATISADVSSPGECRVASIEELKEKLLSYMYPNGKWRFGMFSGRAVLEFVEHEGILHAAYGGEDYPRIWHPPEEFPVDITSTNTLKFRNEKGYLIKLELKEDCRMVGTAAHENGHSRLIFPPEKRN